MFGWQRGCEDARRHTGPDEERKEGQVHGGGWTFRLGSVSSSRLLEPVWQAWMQDLACLGCLSVCVFGCPACLECQGDHAFGFYQRKIALQATVPLDRSRLERSAQKRWGVVGDGSGPTSGVSRRFG